MGMFTSEGSLKKWGTYDSSIAVRQRTMQRGDWTDRFWTRELNSRDIITRHWGCVEALGRQEGLQLVCLFRFAASLITSVWSLRLFSRISLPKEFSPQEWGFTQSAFEASLCHWTIPLVPQRWIVACRESRAKWPLVSYSSCDGSLK